MGTNQLHLRILGVAAFAPLPGCARETYDAGDWQVDVSAPIPAGSEYLRVCVEGAPVTELGAGNGRAAVPALLPVATSVRVEVEDESGEQLLVSAWTAVSDDGPYVVAEALQPDGVRCVDDGDFAEDGDDSRLLVLRFSE